MKLKPLPSPVVVKREDKEGQLKGFIREHLAACAQAEARHVTKPFRLVARSMESPAARALLAVGAELAGSGIHMDAIFAMVDAPGASWLEANATPFAVQVRHAANPKLLDAHEQLILAETTVWIGDCMRRDPSKRDAYESFTFDNREMARHAEISFDRLWAMSRPVCRRGAMEKADAAGPDLADMAFTAPADANTGTLASTRH